MRLRSVLVCVLWVLLSIDYAYPKTFYLYPDRVNLLIVGEEAAVKTVALDKKCKESYLQGFRRFYSSCEEGRDSVFRLYISV